jgi:hypothetical protein
MPSAAVQRIRGLRLVPVTVTNGSPLTVHYPDGSVNLAVGVVGLAYPTSGSYVALLEDGRIPLVLPVTSTP